MRYMCLQLRNHCRDEYRANTNCEFEQNNKTCKGGGMTFQSKILSLQISK